MKHPEFKLENPPRILYREEARQKFEELKRTIESLGTKKENAPEPKINLASRRNGCEK